jgi:hypothetical protein
MLSEEQVLLKLDNYKLGYYCSFIDLGHVYSYLIDSRLNIFRSEDGHWAIAAERLGFNEKAGSILLDIYYFGNCLINLEHYNGQDTNGYSVTPVDDDNFNKTTDGFTLNPNAEYWIVRGQKVKLSHDKQDYINAGIELKGYEPDEISIEAAGRLVITKYRDLFRATDEELYKSIPTDLEKILVIDEWYHRDFEEVVQPYTTDQQLYQAFELNKDLKEQLGMDKEALISLFRQQEQRTEHWNQIQWQDNRPSSYETWQQIAKVIITGDTSFYKPTLEANTHWKHWPDSGSL